MDVVAKKLVDVCCDVVVFDELTRPKCSLEPSSSRRILKYGPIRLG